VQSFPGLDNNEYETEGRHPTIDHTVIVETLNKSDDPNMHNFYRRRDGQNESFGDLIASISIPAGVKWAAINLKSNYGLY